MNRLQSQVIDHKRQIKNWIAQVHNLKIQQKHGGGIAGAGYDDVFGTVITVHHRHRMIEHSLGFGFDCGGEVGMDARRSAMVGINT